MNTKTRARTGTTKTKKKDKHKYKGTTTNNRINQDDDYVYRCEGLGDYGYG